MSLPRAVAVRRVSSRRLWAWPRWPTAMRVSASSGCQRRTDGSRTCWSSSSARTSSRASRASLGRPVARRRWPRAKRLRERDLVVLLPGGSAACVDEGEVGGVPGGARYEGGGVAGRCGRQGGPVGEGLGAVGVVECSGAPSGAEFGLGEAAQDVHGRLGVSRPFGFTSSGSSVVRASSGRSSKRACRAARCWGVPLTGMEAARSRVRARPSMVPALGWPTTR